MEDVRLVQEQSRLLRETIERVDALIRDSRALIETVKEGRDDSHFSRCEIRFTRKTLPRRARAA